MSRNADRHQDAWSSRILTRVFRRYVRRFVRRNFNAVRVAGGETALTVGDRPLICFVNHPGWWDPMTAVLLTDQYFSARQFAAPMDAEALKRYPILERLGFFPVEKDSPAGARQFLKTSRLLFQRNDIVLWMTPSGVFSDVRKTVPFMSGLSHITGKGFRGTLLPVALEYTFWNERYPEMLVQFGSALDHGELPDAAEERNTLLENRLAAAQASLAAKAISRDPGAFDAVQIGRSGIGGFYETFRRAVAVASGRPYHSRHDPVREDQ